MGNIQSSKITPCLWFNDNAELAVNYYVSIFQNSKINKLVRYGKNMPLPEGTVLTVTFELDGYQMMALNGGPMFHFTEAISFIINCGSQSEIDYFWEKLSEGGEEQNCGWLKDQFGLSWQVVPSDLDELMSSDDPARSNRVMAAIQDMIKLDVEILRQAYTG